MPARTLLRLRGALLAAGLCAAGAAAAIEADADLHCDPLCRDTRTFIVVVSATMNRCAAAFPDRAAAYAGVFAGWHVGRLPIPGLVDALKPGSAPMKLADTEVAASFKDRPAPQQQPYCGGLQQRLAAQDPIIPDDLLAPYGGAAARAAARPADPFKPDRATVDALARSGRYPAITRAAVARSGAPKRLLAADPVYPAQALRDGLEGYVNLVVFVDASGKVVAAAPAGGQPQGVFDYAATEAAMRLRFEPYRFEGHPQNWSALQRFDFKLPPDAAPP